MKRFVLLVAVLLVVAACGDHAPPATEGPFDLDALIDQAAVAMGGLQSARFTMERSGAPVEVAGLEFESAEGQYAAPASARAILRVQAAGIAVEVGTIAIEDRVWLTNPLTGGWEEIPAGSGFNIALIFDPQVGWVPLLTEDLSNVVYQGVGDAGDGDRHIIHGSIAASRVEFLTAGLVEAQSVDADIWIHPGTGHITRVEFETTLEGAVSRWVIGLSEFDRPVAIEAPDGA